MFDVVIIGGGFAGLSTALHICNNSDLNVVLVDKGKIGDPSKTSAATFSEVVEKYGLQKFILQDYDTFTIRSELGSLASFSSEAPFLHLLDYENTCKKMLKVAKRGNLEVHDGTEVKNIKTSNSVSVITNDEVLEADVVIDASGSGFVTAKALGLPRPQFLEHSYGWIMDGCKVENPYELCFFGGKHSTGGGWAYPEGKNKLKFGTAIANTELTFPERELVERMHILRNAFEPYNRIMEDGQIVHIEKGSLPVGYVKLVHGRICLVGDAAGLVSPWAVEGLRPAVESGEMCAHAIINAFNGSLDVNKLKLYQEMWNSRYKQAYDGYAKRFTKKFTMDDKGWDSHVRKAKRQRAGIVLRVLKNGTLPLHLVVESYLRSLLRF